MSNILEPRYGMVIDMRRCVGCHACTVACKMENSSPKEFSRSWVLEADKGTYPEVSRVKLPRLCNHCANAPCVEVCPTSATYYSTGGVIVIDETLCIECGECLKACPYDARYIDTERKSADKCDLCLTRVASGLMPPCISTCISHARFFGNLNDPDSEISILIKQYGAEVLKPELGTEPSVYYIGLTDSGAKEVLPAEF